MMPESTSYTQEMQRNALTEGAKMSNPKELIGDTKTPLALVPDIIAIEASMAFLEGALKYGRFNWRAMGVKASTYKSAIERHIGKWWNGEDRDKKTRVKHLASAIACLGIILDAELCGKLNDDRPPKAPLDKRLEEQQDTIKHLKELFKDCDPHQWTINDEEPVTTEEIVVKGAPLPEEILPKPLDVTFELMDTEPSEVFQEFMKKYGPRCSESEGGEQ